MKWKFFLLLILMFLVFPKRAWADVPFVFFNPVTMLFVVAAEGAVSFLYYNFLYLRRRTVANKVNLGQLGDVHN